MSRSAKIAVCLVLAVSGILLGVAGLYAADSLLVVKTQNGTNLSDPLTEVTVVPSGTITFIAQGSQSGVYMWEVVGQSQYSATPVGARLAYVAGPEERVTDYVTVNDGMGQKVIVTVHVAKVLTATDNSETRGGTGPGCFLSLLSR